MCETGSPQIGVITEKANKSWNDDMKNNIRSAAPDVYFLVGEARIGGERRLKGEERSEAIDEAWERVEERSYGPRMSR